MKKKNHFSTGLLLMANLIIIAVTVYFCLDMFEIITVPEEYSLVDILASKISVASAGESEEGNYDDTTPERRVRRERIEDIASNIIDNTVVYENPFEKKEESKEETTYEEPEKEQVVYTTEGSQTSLSAGNLDIENKFHYKQLDIYGKLIYDELYRHVEDLKTGLYTINFGTTFNSLMHEEDGAAVLENDFQLAVNSLVFDKPEIFFLDITKMYLYTEITSFGPKKTYRISIGPSNGVSYLAMPFNDSTDVEVAKYRMDNIVSTIISPVADKTAKDKIKAVHDYIIENCEYDETISKPNIYSMYGVYINRTAVCEGYSKAFKYAMDCLNIPCIIACGIGQNSSGQQESHAWNYVKIDDTWYGVDCTWDDPIIIGYGNATNKMRYHYFLVGSQELFQDHTEDGNLVGDYRFYYPELSLTNY